MKGAIKGTLSQQLVLFSDPLFICVMQVCLTGRQTGCTSVLLFLKEEWAEIDSRALLHLLRGQ